MMTTVSLLPTIRTATLLAGIWVTACAFSLAPAAADPVRMAVMGDTLSNIAWGLGGPSWGEHLQMAHPESYALEHHADWYVTASDVRLVQLPDVLASIGQNEVELVTTVIAGYDAYYAALTLRDTGTVDSASVIADYVNNSRQVLDAVKAANPNVRQVFGSMVDLASTPVADAYPAEYVPVIDAIIRDANAQVNAYALSQGIPVIDLFGLYEMLAQVSTATPFELGGRTFNRGFHPSYDEQPQSWGQGLIANIVATAYNEAYGMSLPLLSDQQIVANAGYVPNDEITYYDVSRFVLLPVPEPSTWGLCTAALLTVGAARLRVRGFRKTTS